MGLRAKLVRCVERGVRTGYGRRFMIREGCRMIFQGDWIGSDWRTLWVRAKRRARAGDPCALPPPARVSLFAFSLSSSLPPTHKPCLWYRSALQA